MKYRPEIDGIRAIAILPVLLFHLGFKWCSGGFVGVDIFFVVSGYLITSIIQRDLDRGSFTIGKFYDRRIRRIFPALYVVLAVTSLAAYLVLMPVEMEAYCKSLLSGIFFVSNFYFWRDAGYFDIDSKMKPLLHTWSLSIEEQFYLLYPTVLLLIHLYLRRWRNGAVLALCLCSFLAGVWMTHSRPNAAYYFSPVRAWELFLGALLALRVVPGTDRRPVNELFSWLGLALIAYSVHRFSSKTAFPGLNAAIPCLGTAFLIHFSGKAGSLTGLGRILASPPMTGIGKISYSLYLWHWPAIVLWKYETMRDLSGWDRLAVSTLVLALSFLSWKFVEQPFRERHGVFRRISWVLAPLGAATVLLCAFAVPGGFLTSGYPGRVSEQARRYAMGAKDINPDRPNCHSMPVSRVEGGDLCVLGSPLNPPEFIVWGDSFADAMMPAVKNLAAEYKVSGLFASTSACGPFLGLDRTLKGSLFRCDEFNAAMLENVRKKGIRNVLLISGWGMGGYRRTDPSNSPDEGTHREERHVRFGLAQTLDHLRSLDSRVWLVSNIPTPGFDVPAYLAKYEARNLDKDLLRFPPTAFLKSRKRISGVLDGLRREYRFEILDLSPALCPGDCIVEADGRALYYDRQHLTTYGARRTEPEFRPFFESVVRREK